MIEHGINEKPFQKIMKSEGGLNTKEPKSVGGKSYAGIAQKTYEAWKAKKCQIEDAPSQVEELAGKALGTEYEKKNPFDIPEEYEVRTDVIRAFYQDYFTPAQVQMLPVCLQYIHMDFFVNSYSSANKIIQRILGFEGKDVDGVLGRGSKAKLEEFTQKFETELENDSHLDNDLIEKYHQLKLEHYESLKEKNPELYKENIKGWKRRAQHVLSELSEYFEDEEPTTSAIDENEEVIDIFEVEEQKDDMSNNSVDNERFTNLEDKVDKLFGMFEQLLNSNSNGKKKNSFFV